MEDMCDLLLSSALASVSGVAKREGEGDGESDEVVKATEFYVLG